MIDISRVYKSNNYGDFKIINYIGSRNIEIEFISTGYRTITQVYNIRNGLIKDRLSPSIYGVGVVGDGDYPTTIKGKATKAHTTWRNMLKRCYCPSTQERYPTYKGCTVCDEWHNFQVFSVWFDENYIDGLHLDKDIRQKGNKVYSPDTCMFVSPAENVIEAHAKHYTFLSPQGELVDVYNLSEFCCNNTLNGGNMSSVHLGKIKNHRGWTKA